MTASREQAAEAIATEVLAVQTEVRQIAPFSERLPGFDLDRAYAAAAALRRLRSERGDAVVGRKIGFTNRALWAPYNVDAPIWGYMYASTVHDIAAAGETFSLSHLCECQIEPEIAFKLAAPPTPDMDEAALLACIEWCAHGFEIVASSFPAWRFTAADCVAVGGLHGALLLGAPQKIESDQRAEWLRQLGSFRLELLRGDEAIDRGEGTNVLGHPLGALRHLVSLLARDAHNPPLAAGEIVTTGSVTRAFPIRPGERWRTEIEGLPLAGVSLAFS
jgi:2-oxo-3-hexenedioate decarboxylase